MKHFCITIYKIILKAMKMNLLSGYENIPISPSADPQRITLQLWVRAVTLEFISSLLEIDESNKLAN